MNLPNPLGSLRKKTFAAAAVRALARRRRLSVETLETRVVPASPALSTPHAPTTHAAVQVPPFAVLPTPTIDEATKQSLTAGFAPMTITDPTTPSHMVTVYSTGTKILAITSVDGGTTWSAPNLVPFSINDSTHNTDGSGLGFGVEPKASVPPAI